MRNIRVFSVLLALLVVWVWPLAGAAQQAEDDRGYIQGLLEDSLSGAGREVRIVGFAGALRSRATIEEITIADDEGVWLTMTDLALTWSRSRLLRGEVDIDQITVGRIEMPRLPVTVAQEEAPTPEARSPFALPDLPVSLRLEELDLQEVVLGAPVATEDVVLRVTGAAALAGGEGDATLEVTRLDRGGELRLAGAYSNASRILRLDTRFAEPAGGIAATLLSLPGAPSVTLSLTGDAPIDDFEGRLQLATDGAERLAGTVVLHADGDAETERVTLDVGGDLAPVVAPAYREFLGDDIQLRVDAVRRSSGALELEDLTLRAEALSLTGRAALAPDGWPDRLSLSGSIVPPTGEEVLLPLPTQIYVRGVDLTGEFDASAGNGWQLGLEARGVTTENGGADLLSLTGRGEIDRDASRVQGRLRLAAGGIDMALAALEEAIGSSLRGGLDFDWRPGAPLTLTNLDLSGADYGLTGGLTLDETETLNPVISPDLRLAAEDLSRFAALAGVALRGGAELAIIGEVAPVSGAFDLSLDGTTRGLATGIPQVDPLIGGVGSLQLEVSRTEAGLGAERLLLITPEARIEGSGTLATGASQGRIEARIRETRLVLPELSGPTQVTVSALQSGDTWSLEASGDLAGAGQLTYAGTVDLSDDVPFVAGQVEAALTRLSAFSELAGQRLTGSATLSVTGEGRADGSTFSVNATGGLRDVALGIEAVDPLLRGRTDLTLVARRAAGGAIRFEPVTLSGPINARFVGDVQPDGADGPEIDGRLTADARSLAPLSGLTGLSLRGGAEIDVQARGGLTAGALAVTGFVRGQGLGIGNSTVDPLFAGASRLDLDVVRDATGALRINDLGLDASGLDADVTGRYGPGASADLALDVRLANLGTIVPDINGAARVSGTARRSGGPWQLALDGSGPAGIGLTVGGTAAADFGRFDLDLRGAAPLALANGRLAPQVVNGTLRFDLALNGPPQLSALSGTLSTSGARFAVPAQNIILNNLSGDARLAGGRAQLGFTASLESGGQVSLQGPVTLSAPFNADLAVVLRQAVLRQADLFETTANGEIDVTGPLTGGARISGRVDLGTVEARVPNIGASYTVLDGLQHVAPPRDVQLTLQFAGLNNSGPSGGGAPLPAFPLDLLVSAESRIFVRGRGLDAELGGQLRLTGTSANVVPVGQFDLIRGRLDLLGRRLDLTEGFVALRGSFDPVIRFVAVTRVEDTEITITIEGPASSPELVVGSIPELPQDEALSFFLFGRSVTELSALQAVQLAAAIRTLSGRGGLGLTEQLRSGLGVSDLDIGTADDGTVEARVGGYISENLYSDVTVDARGQSEINLNLTVNPNVTVRGRLGSDGSSGLGIYFEKDY